MLETQPELELDGSICKPNSGLTTLQETGSQSYVPLDPRNDKALNAALDLMRGRKANAAFPPVRGAAN